MPEKLSTETIARMAGELHGAPMKDGEVQPVVDLLGALLDEFTPMRNLDVGSSEPAILYDASQS
jgi:hypothetical protein